MRTMRNGTAHGQSTDSPSAPHEQTPGWTQGPDGRLHLRGVSRRRDIFNRRVTSSFTGFEVGVQRHWLAFINFMLAIFLSVAILTPILYALGWQPVGGAIFRAYHFVCAQIPSHSYFLFGYQLALCARNLAIFSSLFVGSLAFRSVRHWLRPLDWRLWVATMIPMAWDGGTQLFGWRESNWELRTLTGAIFGLGVCWFVLPYLESAADDSAPARRAITLDLRGVSKALRSLAVTHQSESRN